MRAGVATLQEVVAMDKSAAFPADPVAGLIDMPLPPAIGLWPQTLPARIVCVAAVVAIVLALGRATYLWHVNRYRREALADFERIVSGPDEQIVSRLAILVRRTALTVFPRADIADLSGNNWLAFLDRSYGGHEFSAGAGRVLANGPYASSQNKSSTLPDLVRRWIRTHHV